MLLLIESVCCPVILCLVVFSLTSLDLPVYCNKLSHYNCNSIMWGWMDRHFLGDACKACIA